MKRAAFVTAQCALAALALSACAGAGSGIARVTAIPAPPRAIESAPRAATDTPAPTPSPQPSATALPSATPDSAPTAAGANPLQLPTLAPSAGKLEPGVARAIALATDVAMQPEDAPAALSSEQPTPLRFAEFYSGFSVRKGLVLSDKLKSLDGKPVVIEGYVAPPLKPKLDFFVLTRVQLAYCPFCSSDVEWPNDIALIYLPERRVLSSEYPVRITGQLEIGSSADAETGMVSLVRIYAQDLEILD